MHEKTETEAREVEEFRRAHAVKIIQSHWRILMEQRKIALKKKDKKKGKKGKTKR